jgi:hypothetical protein
MPPLPVTDRIGDVVQRTGNALAALFHLYTQRLDGADRLWVTRARQFPQRLPDPGPYVHEVRRFEIRVTHVGGDQGLHQGLGNQLLVGHRVAPLLDALSW